MKLVRMTVLSAVAAAVLGAAVPVIPAMADDAFKFSFDVGNVRLGFADGYWDNDHHWHKWANDREAREFHSRYHDRYVGDRHDRFRNAGWRDSDHDGIPNYLDGHPYDPNRG